jgi:hypothetical protein
MARDDRSCGRIPEVQAISLKINHREGAMSDDPVVHGGSLVLTQDELDAFDSMLQAVIGRRSI